ncbi:hypothetical protein JCM9957A_58650 [Kineosporia succinea]
MLRAPDPDVDDVVRRELLVQSAEAARLSNLLGYGLLATADGVLWATGLRTGEVLAWTLGLLAWLAVFHVVVPIWVCRPARAGRPVDPLRRRFTVIQGVTGTLWGSVCVFVRPGEGQAELFAVAMATLVLANAANLLFCCATPGAYLAYHAGIVVAGVTGFASQGNWGLVALVAFGGFGAMPLTRYGYQQVAGARLLARQNHLLADELRTEREAVERANLRLSEANAELAHQATRDPLTGLPNRTLFFEHLTSSLALSRETGRRLGVIYFDLDRFKIINDTLGHGAGDDLLVQVGERVTAVLRGADVLTRLGGDEFVVLTSQNAAGVAERVRRVLAEPFALDGRSVRVSSSLGVAVDDGRADGEQLVEFADVALYRAKEGGRNRVAVFTPEMLATTGTDDERLNRLLAGKPPQPRRGEAPSPRAPSS